jgi:hypothetical protein
MPRKSSSAADHACASEATPTIAENRLRRRSGCGKLTSTAITKKSGDNPASGGGQAFALTYASGSAAIRA